MGSIIRALLAALLLGANLALVAFLAFGSFLVTAEFLDHHAAHQLTRAGWYLIALARFVPCAAVDLAFVGAAFFANRGFLRELLPDAPRLPRQVALLSGAILLAVTTFG